MCSWVITAPRLQKNEEAQGLGHLTLSDTEMRLYFEKAYEFLNERYAGSSDNDVNVISAYVHMDETTPHMHYAFVPIVHDHKKNIDKVSAKSIINRTDLQSFHNDLDQYMTKVFGRDIGVLNEATKDGNKTIAKLKRETANQELRKTIEKDKAELETKRQQIEEEKRQLETEQQRLKAEKRDIEGKIALTSRINKVMDNMSEQTTGIMAKNKVTSTIIKGMTNKDLSTVLKAAADRDSMKIRMETAVKKAEDERDAAIVDKNTAIKEKEEDIKKVGREADKEINKQKAIAQAATDTWGEVLGILKERGYKIGDRDPMVGDIPDALRWYAKERTKHKKVTDTVPDLENRISVLENQVLKLTTQNAQLQKQYNSAEVALLNIADEFIAAGKGSKSIEVDKIIAILNNHDTFAISPKYKNVALELERVFARVIERER
jgi:chromosome segregation ATPase